MKKIDRFDKYMKAKGLNDNKVTTQLGLSVGSIGKSRKEGRDLSDKIIEQILNFYTDINRVWLLTGEGEMLRSVSSGLSVRPSEGRDIPLIPVSAQGGSLNDFVVSVTESGCERIISPLRDAELAVTVAGDSMAPEYPSGSRILIKKVNEKAFIEWGKAYVLDTCNGVVVKILTPSDKEDRVRCVSVNTEPQYAPFDVCWKDVFGVYRVLMVIVSK